MANSPDPKAKEIQVVYMGRANLASGKAGFFVCLPGHCENASAFSGKASASTVGALYTCRGEIADNQVTSIGPKTLKFAGNSRESDENVAQWEACDNAFRLLEQSRAFERKLQRGSYLQKAVLAIARAYRHTPANARNAFRVWLLGKLDD